MHEMGAEARCGSCVQSEGLSGNGFGEERVRLPFLSGSKGEGFSAVVEMLLKQVCICN